MKIDIIIPNYNGSHLIRKNIGNVLSAIKSYSSEIIIVDDGSNKEDRESLKIFVKELNEKKKPVRLILHKVNKGFSSAVNTGVKNSKSDLVVLLNSDVSPTNDFIKSPIGKFIKFRDLFSVGCLDISHEGKKLVKRGSGYAKWKRGMVQHGEGNISYEKTFWTSGGSSFFRREIYMKLNGMDEIYNPFYWEDIDLSYRAQKSGYKVIFDRNSKVHHLHEEGAIRTNFKKKRITTIAYRNQFIFIWKNITDINLFLSHIFFLPLNIALAMKGGDMELLKGFFLATLKLPAIISKRFSQKKYYKLSDSEIFNNFL